MIPHPFLIPITATSLSPNAGEGFVTVKRDEFVFTLHPEHADEIIACAVLTENMEDLIARHGASGDGGRGAVARVEIPGIGPVFVRDYRHGGLLRAVFDRRFFIPGRETRELHVLKEARSRDLPVPVPLASARKLLGFGRGYHARIVTAEIPHASSLVPTLWEKADRGLDASPLLFSTGKAIRAMHNAGIHHHDLNMHNILVDEEETVFIIDFDRARIRKNLGTRGRIANLRRLLRSGRKLTRLHHDAPHGWFSDDRFGELLRGYSEGDENLYRKMISKTIDFTPLKIRSHIGWALDDLLYRNK